MWGGQGGGGWGQWGSLQQSAYANVPSDQVDWASLAKQWMTQKEEVMMIPMMTDFQLQQQQQQAMSGATSNRFGTAGGSDLMMSGVGSQLDSAANSEPENTDNSLDASNFGASGGMPGSTNDAGGDQNDTTGVGEMNQTWNNWNNTGGPGAEAQWGGMPAWAVPPPPPPEEDSKGDMSANEMQMDDSNGPFLGGNGGPQDMFQGVGPGMHMGMGQQQPFNFTAGNEFYPPQFDQSGFVPQGFWGGPPELMSMNVAPMMMGGPAMLRGMAPMGDGMDFRGGPRRPMLPGFPNLLPPGAGQFGMMPDSGIDAAKRRHLPAWIREGLEKMEREKMKQMEKERAEQEAEEARKAALEEAAQREKDQAEGGVIRSKFDSDDDEDVEKDDNIDEEDEKVIRSGLGAVTTTNTTITPTISAATRRKRSPSVEEEEEEPPPMSEEERQARLVLRVRQMLTEILLEVTNEQIASIAQSVYSSLKQKQSKGLGYGSSDDEEADGGSQSEGDDDKSGTDKSESSESDDEALQERIRRKRSEFEAKTREREEREQAEEAAQRGGSVTNEGKTRQNFQSQKTQLSSNATSMMQAHKDVAQDTEQRGKGGSKEDMRRGSRLSKETATEDDASGESKTGDSDEKRARLLREVADLQRQVELAKEKRKSDGSQRVVSQREKHRGSESESESASEQESSGSSRSGSHAKSRDERIRSGKKTSGNGSATRTGNSKRRRADECEEEEPMRKIDRRGKDVPDDDNIDDMSRSSRGDDRGTADKRRDKDSDRNRSKETGKHRDKERDKHRDSDSVRTKDKDWKDHDRRDSDKRDKDRDRNSEKKDSKTRDTDKTERDRRHKDDRTEKDRHIDERTDKDDSRGQRDISSGSRYRRGEKERAKDSDRDREGGGGHKQRKESDRRRRDDESSSLVSGNEEVEESSGKSHRKKSKRSHSPRQRVSDGHESRKERRDDYEEDKNGSRSGKKSSGKRRSRSSSRSADYD